MKEWYNFWHWAFVGLSVWVSSPRLCRESPLLFAPFWRRHCRKTHHFHAPFWQRHCGISCVLMPQLTKYYFCHCDLRRVLRRTFHTQKTRPRSGGFLPVSAMGTGLRYRLATVYKTPAPENESSDALKPRVQRNYAQRVFTAFFVRVLLMRLGGFTFFT